MSTPHARLDPRQCLLLDEDNLADLEEEQEEPDDDYPALKPSDAEMGELA
ncbi:hypothetical protein EMGR_002557 [Emarellia grisea]